MAAGAVTRHFERVAAGYGALRSRWPLGHLRRREQAAVRQLVAVRPGQLVVDAGCGDGEILQWLASAGATAVGVDVTWPMAAACRRRGFLVCVQDAERLGLRPRFDWALCIGALEFMERPEAAIAGLAASLRPGGRLALLFPRRTVLGRAYAAYHRVHGVPVRLFTRPEIDSLVRASGLEPVSAWRDCLLSTACVAARANGAA